MLKAFPGTITEERAILQERGLSSGDVQRTYRSFASDPRSDVIEMIGLYPHWVQERWTCEDVGSLEWYLCAESGHVSRVLSREGRKRKVIDVARKYDELAMKGELVLWEEFEKIESMVSAITNGARMSPLIVIPGEKYANSPECSFLDGVHRSLAYCVNYLRTGENFEVEVLVGRKAPLLSRLRSRVGI